MDDLQVQDMTEVAAKLRNLRTTMPNVLDPLLYDFAESFADRLNQKLVPLGFLMALNLYVYDLGQGVNGFTGKPMPGNLVGNPPMVYLLLEAVFMKTIAPVVLPESFMTAVNTALAEIKAEAAQARNKVP